MSDHLDTDSGYRRPTGGTNKTLTSSNRVYLLCSNHQYLQAKSPHAVSLF